MRTGAALAGGLTAVLALAACGSGGGTAAVRSFGPAIPLPAGRGPRFHLPARSPAVAAGRPVGGLYCRADGPRHGAHLELFVHAKVVPVPAGIGIAGPVRRERAAILGGRCAYPVITRDPTGLLEIRDGAVPALGDLFALWDQPLSARRLAGFHGVVRAYVNGRRWPGAPQAIPLGRHVVVSLIIGGGAPVHTGYTFPAGL